MTALDAPRQRRRGCVVESCRTALSWLVTMNVNTVLLRIKKWQVRKYSWVSPREILL